MKTNWWVWERAATMHLMYAGSRSCGKVFKKEWGVSWPDIYCVFRNGMAKFICDPVKIVERGKGIIGKYYFDERSFKEKDEKGKWFNDEFIKLFGKFDKIDLASVSDKGLLELYTEFDDFYEKWWGFTEVAELISEGAGAMLKESLSNDRMKYFDILVEARIMPKMSIAHLI